MIKFTNNFISLIFFILALAANSASADCSRDGGAAIHSATIGKYNVSIKPTKDGSRIVLIEAVENGFSRCFEYYDYPISLFTTTDLEDHVVTLWVSGTSYVVRIFDLKDQRILLESYSRHRPPSILWPLANNRSLPDVITYDSVGNDLRPIEHYFIYIEELKKYSLKPLGAN